MKIKGKRLALALVSIAVLVVSLTIMLLDIFVPLAFWTHPVLNFLFCLFVGFGVICMGLGFSQTSPWYFFLSSILLGLALIYALMQYILWWIGLIIVGVVWGIFAVLSFIVAGNKTEDIALNKSPDYKTYEQRKAEKEAAEANKETEKLPEIKSFK